MVNSASHVCAYMLMVAGWMMAIFTSVYPVWKKNVLLPEEEGDVPPVQKIGIWYYCFDEMDYWSCYPYESPVPRPIKLFRLATSIVIALGFVGIVLGAIGLNCTTLASQKTRTKSRLAIAAGVLHVIGGVVLGAVVTLFAATAFREMNNATLEYLGIFVTSHAPGESLFVGWAGAAAYLLGGIVLCCTARNQEDVNAKPTEHRSPEEGGLVGDKEM